MRNVLGIVLVLIALAVIGRAIQDTDVCWCAFEPDGGHELVATTVQETAHPEIVGTFDDLVIDCNVAQY